MTTSNTQMLFSRTELYILLSLGVISLVLGMIGFAQYFSNVNQATTFSDLAYNTLNLFLLQFSIQGSIPLSLDLARWIAPATLSYTIVKTLFVLIRDRIRRIRIRHFHRHAIVVGLNKNSVGITRYFLDRKIKTIVVDEEQNEFWGDIVKHGAFKLQTNLSDMSFLNNVNVKEASYLLINSSSDTVNLKLIHEVFSHKNTQNDSTILNSVTQIHSKALMRVLNNRPLFATDHQNTKTRLINYSKVSARWVSNEFGPDSLIDNFSQQSSLHIMLMGDQQIVSELAYRFTEIGVYGFDNPLKITLVGENVETIKAELLSDHPALNRLIELQHLSISRLNTSQIKSALEASNSDIFYLCFKHTDNALLVLQNFVDFSINNPVVVCESDDRLTFEWLEKEFSSYANIRFASRYDPNLLYEGVFGDIQDNLAKTIHNNYVRERIADGDTRKKNTSLVNWDELPELLKSANRNQADHMLIKCRILTGKTVYTPKDIQQALNPQTLIDLAKIEHRRWVIEKQLDGWQYTSGSKNAGKRLSPSIIDWNELSDDEKQKDIETIKQLPDLINQVTKTGNSLL